MTTRPSVRYRRGRGARWRLLAGLALAVVAAVVTGLHWVAPAAAASLVTISNAGRDAAIPAGGSTSVGFQGS